MNHMSSQITTVDYIGMQTNAMWDAYARTTELDCIVDMDKLVDYINMYLATVQQNAGLLAAQVAESVMSDYLNMRYSKQTH